MNFILNLKWEKMIKKKRLKFLYELLKNRKAFQKTVSIYCMNLTEEMLKIYNIFISLFTSYS